MVVTYYIKLFRTGADRHNGILMSLLPLVAETNMQVYAKYIRNKMQDSTFADIDFSNFSSSIFKVNHNFIEEEDSSVGKVVADEDKLDGIEIDDLLNLENLSRTGFID